MLLEVPLEAGGAVLVEADAADIPGGLVLAAADPGTAAAVATATLEQSLGRLEPVLRALADRLRQVAPQDFTVEFGVKLGGEAGIILAKGTSEVNFTVRLGWSRPDAPASA
jgi:hypothetical protein